MAMANSYRPRTLDEKTKEADLIVLGTASLFGAREQLVTNIEYWQNIRLDIKAVLWPQTFTNTSRIVFRSFVSETWPGSWWAYTNTPGVFFLVKRSHTNSGDWDRLDQFADWMEPRTKALAVLLSINQQKGKPNTNGPLKVPALTWPRNTRYDGNNQLRQVYLLAFRDGYSAALEGEHHILVFNPSTEEEKAKVLGFADCQLEGDNDLREWLRNIGI